MRSSSLTRAFGGLLDPVQSIATNQKRLEKSPPVGSTVVCSCELGPLEAEAGGLKAPDWSALL